MMVVRNIEYEKESLGYKFSSLVNETDKKTLKQGTDYSVILSTNEHGESIWKITIYKSYL